MSYGNYEYGASIKTRVSIISNVGCFDKSVSITSKAGSGVPLKWRILDDAGNPVTTLTTARISTSPLACSTGASLDDIEELSTAAAILQNLGNGYYSLVWKTSKEFAGLCKTLKLDLGEGITRNAAFKLTR